MSRVDVYCMARVERCFCGSYTLVSMIGSDLSLGVYHEIHVASNLCMRSVDFFLFFKKIL